jgi:hypothetical protein
LTHGSRVDLGPKPDDQGSPRWHQLPHDINHQGGVTNSIFYASVILFHHVVFVLTGAVVDVRAEFLGDDLSSPLTNRARVESMHVGVVQIET